MELKTTIIHHTGGIGNDYFAKSSHLTLEHLDNAHRARWPDFKSSLGYWVGYTFLIFPDGSWKQTRKLGEEGAHTKGFNKDSIGICLLGNFTLKNGSPIETPTKAQELTLQRILSNLLKRPIEAGYIVAPDTKFNLSQNRIYPHRFFSQTECYGNYLDDNWARNLVTQITDPDKTLQIELLQKLLNLYRQLLDFYQKRQIGKMKFGADERSCEGMIYE